MVGPKRTANCHQIFFESSQPGGVGEHWPVKNGQFILNQTLGLSFIDKRDGFGNGDGLVSDATGDNFGACLPPKHHGGHYGGSDDEGGQA